MQDKFEYEKGGYNKTSTELKDEEILCFKTAEEAEKFKNENVLDDENEYNAAQRNIIFDDETLSISYQLQNKSSFSLVGDILPVFMIICYCGFITVFIVSVVIYVKNKKKLN